MQDSEQWWDYNTLIHHPYPYPYLLTVLAANGDFFKNSTISSTFLNWHPHPSFPSSIYSYSSSESPLDPYFSQWIITHHCPYVFDVQIGSSQGPLPSCSGSFSGPCTPSVFLVRPFFLAQEIFQAYQACSLPLAWSKRRPLQSTGSWPIQADVMNASCPQGPCYRMLLNRTEPQSSLIPVSLRNGPH